MEEAFEEIIDFLYEQHMKDISREAQAKAEAKAEAIGFAQGEAIGVAKGMKILNKIIKTFMSNNPSYTVHDAAIILDIDERLIREQVPDRS